MRSCLLLAIAALPFQFGNVHAQVSVNPFADFETHYLSNGLKLWYKHLSTDPVVSISVALPFGADQDPPGKEQLAHFAEHMLFSDRPGRTEEEIKREIEERGGVYNASVSADRSFYYVRIGSEHALFALEWLYRILAPHAMDQEIVDRQRQPVALEVGARPRQFFDWLWACYLYPPWLRTPGFWEREFGITTLASRDYYPYASLNRIGPSDLRSFYDRYYVPGAMTLTVIGDVPMEAVLEKAAATFGSLPRGPEPPPPAVPRDPKRYRQQIFWAYRPNAFFTERFKFYSLPTRDEIVLIFISRLLDKRLNEQLRFGPRKATYGLRVALASRGAASYLQVSGGIKTDELDFARTVLQQELSTLRNASLPESIFAADRAALIQQLQVAGASSEGLERWVRDFFFDRRVREDFPDLAAEFGRLTLTDLRDFAQNHLLAERRVVTLIRPLPINQVLAIALVIALAWLGVRLARRWLTRPAEMTRLRYAAHFKLPLLYRGLAILLLGILVAIAGRLLAYGFQVLADRMLLTVDSFAVQWTAYAAMWVASVLLLVLLLAHIPRKLLVFEDEVRIKYLSFRSVSISAGAIESVRLRRFRDVWLSRHIWRCLPLTFGLLAPGVYLRRADRRAYFFEVRDRDELMRVLTSLQPCSGVRMSDDPPSQEGGAPG
ncbi:MAG: insulinase family protein [Gemmatimonadota bacterium]|nr:MAG: insulinase family protein [Gemmatimonadota bacterium]